MGEERLTIQDAARRLGVSESAIRKRVSRGTLQHDKGDDRRTYVYVDAPSDTVSDNVSDTVSDTSTSALMSELRSRIDSLEDQISYLREQLAEEREARRRADTIIAQLSQANATLAARVPQLEAPSEPQNEPESTEPRSDRGTPPPPEPEESSGRPWWRRWFGG